MEAAMQEPENKRIKCEEEDYTKESLHLLSILPDLIWSTVLDKLNNSADYFKLCQSFPDSHNLFSGYRTKVLFDDVIKIMVQRLENRQGQDVQLSDLVSLRRICKTWKRGVDSNLQNLTSNYKFSTEYKLPRSLFEKDLDSKFGYRFLQVDDYENFISHFEASHGTADVNPFITRRIIISVWLKIMMPREPQMELLSSSCLDMLKKFGKHVWYLHLETRWPIFTAAVNPSRLFTLVKKILHHLPNLRVLKIDPPLNTIIEHEVDSFPDVPITVPLIPKVSTFETSDETGQNFDCRPEPLVGPSLQLGGQRPIQINFQFPRILGQHPPIQVPGQNPQMPIPPVSIQQYFHIFPANPPAQLRPIIRISANPAAQPSQVIEIPANPLAQPGPVIPVGANILGRGPGIMAGLPNPPIVAAPAFRNPQPDDLPQAPVLLHLRFVQQGKLPFDNFLQIIRPNVQSLTQVGVTINKNEQCQQFFELPLNLTKLEIDFSKPDMPWFVMFPLLENRFGECLESLHIYLPKPVIACQLRLPKLKVLHLLLDSPLPLDFLLGMSYNLEELYLKLGQMNQDESAEVQREEQIVLFYQHLGQLTNSNIWTEFPKLKKVRVSSHTEVENMTPFWQCTVEEWRNRNN